MKTCSCSAIWIFFTLTSKRLSVHSKAHDEIIVANLKCTKKKPHYSSIQFDGPLLQFTATADTISGATLKSPAICRLIEGI